MKTSFEVDQFREAMTRFAGGVTAITASLEGVPYGLIATSVCSLSDSPPSLIACVNKSASAHDVILAARSFAVNLLSVDQQAVVKRFSAERGAARFDPEHWATSPAGVPLLKEAVVTFDCDILDLHDGLTHTIIVGRIKDIAFAEDSALSCLLWHRRGFAEIASEVSAGS
jgi:flavin reductase